MLLQHKELYIKDKVVLLDVDDYDLVTSKGKWHVNNMGYAFRFTSHGYINGKQQTKNILMHRLIMRPPNGMVVDHINGNPLDNRRVNLRIATRSQNMWNSKKPKNNTSGFIGVTWKKDKRKWRSEIFSNGKSMFLGYFDDPREAAEVRDKKAVEIRGEFSVLNRMNQRWVD